MQHDCPAQGPRLLRARLCTPSGCRTTVGTIRRSSDFLKCLYTALHLLLLAALFAPASPAEASQAPPPQPSGAEVTIQAHPPKATVGDPIQIDLDFTLPGAYQLQFPRLPEQVGEFTVLETHPGPEVPSGPGSNKGASPATGPSDPGKSNQRHHHARITVAAYKTGELEFPSLHFTLRDAAGKEIQISTQPITIRIESVLSENDLSLKDLKQQVDFEGPARWLWWLAGGAAALLILALAAWRLGKRPGRPFTAAPARQNIDPLDLAEADLRDLVTRGYLEKGLTKQFYVRLAEIMKSGLEAGYRIQTAEKTTSEIVITLEAALHSDTPASPESGVPPIEHLLLSCDMVKFARYLPTAPENEEAVKEAFRILVECRNRRQPALTSPAAPPAGAP